MQLRDVLYQMMQESLRAAQPADLRVGTVTGINPLEISINPAMAPLKREVLYLTAAVVEKKIPVLGHAHETDGLAHSHTVSGLSHAHTTGGLSHTHAVDPESTGGAAKATGPALSGSYGSDTALTGIYPTNVALSGGVESTSVLGNVQCLENGTPLPVENGYIILNRALAAGDKVLLLRVQGGQKFIVLSRIFKGG